MKPITQAIKSIGLETRKSFAYISQYWKKEVDINRFFPQRSCLEKIVGDRDTTQTISVSPPQEMNFDCQLLKNRKIVCSQAFPDLIKFEDRFYLSFRTATSHFPSGSAKIHIYSSEDTKEWILEHTILHDKDLRDPRFLIFKGNLHLFFISHGRTLFNPHPQNIYRIVKTVNGLAIPT